MSRSRRWRAPEWMRVHGLIALLLCLLLTLLPMALFRWPWRWDILLGLWILAASLVALGYYGFDKSRARQGKRRVPEVVLHGLTLAGGSLGAYAGMRYFRHKTLKGSFRLFFWFVVVLQIGLLAAVLYRLYSK